MTAPADGQQHGRRRVVIVGGGFGGLAAARGLAATDDVDITLVDRRNHHLFQPLLYQVATAGLNPADIARPIRTILAAQQNVAVLLDEVVAVDRSARTITTASGRLLEYDYLILAAGSRHSYFGHPEWEQDAPGLKTVEDALEIRRRVLLAFERAERTDDADERMANLTFVVVGGGPTGVETAGAIAEIAFMALTKEFRAIDPATARVVLLEGADRLLLAYSPGLSEKALRQLEALGVEVRLQVLVTDIDARSVTTSDGSISARTVVWAAGNQASPLGAMLDAEVDRAGRVVVADDLSVPGDPSVFVIGDMAQAHSAGSVVPGVAQGAIQGGTHAALAITADLAGKPRPVFRYRNKGELATIGRSSAVGQIGRIRLSGWTAWMSWGAIHLFFLIGFRSRLLVLFSWGWNYLTFQRGSRLITRQWSPERPPGQP